MDLVSHTVINLIIFVLAIYVGYHVVWTVTPALHTPLMAVTNAISAIVIVGAMLAAALTETPLGKTHGRAGRGAGRGQRLRRLPGHAADAGDVQEEGQARRSRRRRGSTQVSLNLVTLLYLVASVCFIQALKGLCHPDHLDPRQPLRHGRHGDRHADHRRADRQARPAATAIGMGWVLLGLVVGGGYGAYRAKTVEMTQDARAGRVLPQHDRPGGGVHRGRRGGRAVGLRHRRAGRRPSGAIDPIPTGNRLELFLGAAIGAITFSGSVIAFGKLSGKYKFRLFQGAPVQFKGQHMLNLVLGARDARASASASSLTESWLAFCAMLALAFVMGVLIIIPIGGADMPVVVSMLNSYSGWAAAGIGFSLNNAMLIIAGSLVGSSGAILSYIMCKAMNRSFFNVILGGFGGEAGTAGGGRGASSARSRAAAPTTRPSCWATPRP